MFGSPLLIASEFVRDGKAENARSPTQRRRKGRRGWEAAWHLLRRSKSFGWVLTLPLASKPRKRNKESTVC